MDPHKMTLQELEKHFYGRIVQFKLKNGKTKTIFVQDIMNEEDEVLISEIVSACEIKK